MDFAGEIPEMDEDLSTRASFLVNEQRDKIREQTTAVDNKVWDDTFVVNYE